MDGFRRRRRVQRDRATATEGRDGVAQRLAHTQSQHQRRLADAFAAEDHIGAGLFWPSVQIQAQIQLHADVYVYSDGLTDEQIEQALFLPCHNIEATVAELQAKYGPNARICVLPEGPLTIAYLT
ncbi:MAG: hypothetical protein KDE53_05240 [Caldilineaceae bacterium]|nr:hypothetical protein [Caldilineaceae bacterium]